MEDFKSYSARRESAGRTNAPTQNDLADLIARLAGKYNGASEQEIFAAIVREAEKGRRNGTLTDADIDAFASSVLPALDNRQAAKLKKVVARLKSIK